MSDRVTRYLAKHPPTAAVALPAEDAPKSNQLWFGICRVLRFISRGWLKQAAVPLDPEDAMRSNRITKYKPPSISPQYFELPPESESFPGDSLDDEAWFRQLAIIQEKSLHFTKMMLLLLAVLMSLLFLILCHWAKH